MREVAILGVGMTRFGPTNLNIKELFASAALEALAESNLSPKRIQALFVGNVLGDFAEGQINLAGFLANEIGLGPEVPATRIEGACATASIAFRDAFMWVASGMVDVALVGGVEKISHMGTALATRTFAMATDSHYEALCGLTFPGVFSMLANLYADTYKIPLDTLKTQMAQVAVKNHHNGTMNPLAQFQSEITIDKVLNSAMVCDPLQLYDCCPFSDGAAAVVLTSHDIAKQHVSQPVRVLGVGQGSAGALGRQKNFTIMPSRVASARQAYAMADVGPEDIDVCELHDCFTIAEIVASENLGFFEYGDGAAAVQRGDSAINGRIAINPSGGLKSKGHPIGATGCAQIYEITKQLRGECGERQVQGARIGMTDTLGGNAGTVVNIILGR